MTDAPLSSPMAPDRAAPAPAASPALPRGISIRVIGALVLREMSTTYGRSPGGYLWAIAQPVAMIALLSLAFSLVIRAPSLGTSFVLFYATGLLPLRVFQEMARTVGGALRFNRALLSYPRVTAVDALLARAALSFLTQVLVTYVVLTAVLLWQDNGVRLSPVPMVAAIAAAGCLGLGAGALNAVLFAAVPVWQTVWAVLTRPLILVSAVLYVVEDMPRPVQEVLWFNPLTHVTGLMRSGVYATYDPAYVSGVFVSLCAALPLLAGLVFLRRFGRALAQR